MTQLSKLIHDSIAKIVPVSEEREAILQALKDEEMYGGSKSISMIDKYEKIIEDLIK
jgi:1-deoxy-D-xylulose 5-phosphate reductoisomerase